MAQQVYTPNRWWPPTPQKGIHPPLPFPDHLHPIPSIPHPHHTPTMHNFSLTLCSCLSLSQTLSSPSPCPSPFPISPSHLVCPCLSVLLACLSVVGRHVCDVFPFAWLTACSKKVRPEEGAPSTRRRTSLAKWCGEAEEGAPSARRT